MLAKWITSLIILSLLIFLVIGLNVLYVMNLQSLVPLVLGNLCAVAGIAGFIRSIWSEWSVKKTECKRLKQMAIFECDCNIVPGVGDVTNKFTIRSIEDLMNHKYLCDVDTKKQIQEILINANKCNAHGGERKVIPNPGQVKNAFKLLKIRLESLK